MTREEAVIILDGFKNNPLFNSTHIRALDMAISALSEDGEYVKKGDAISKILIEFTERESNGKVMCACADVKQTCADILDGLPSYSFPDSAEINGDLISRQAINGYIDYILSHGMGKKKSFDFIKKFVANLPSATPQDLGHSLGEKPIENKGEWIEVVEEKFPNGEKRIWHYECSDCGSGEPCCPINKEHWDFCPNCGADMRGKE